MPGEPIAAAGRATDPAVWLMGLAPELARRARRALAADRLLVTDDVLEAAVAVIGSPGATLADQRRRAREASERLAPRPVVLVTELDRRSALHRLFATGVHGLVLESELDRALAITVRAVAAGQVCATDRIRAAVAPRPLSARERQILAMVIMGLTNAEIASRLHLAESTVKSHLASTFDKLGVRSRAEAAELVTDPQDMLGTGIVALSAGERRD